MLTSEWRRTLTRRKPIQKGRCVTADVSLGNAWCHHVYIHGGGSKNARGHVLNQPGYEMRAKESKRAIPKKTVGMSVNGRIVSIRVGISLVATNRSRTRELAMTVKATAIVPTPSPTMKGARQDTRSKQDTKDSTDSARC